MRGLVMNLPGVQQSCTSFVRHDALEFLSHNGKWRGQSGLSFSKRKVAGNAVCRERLFSGRKRFDPLCIKKECPQWFSERRSTICRAYGSQPDVPVREEQQVADAGEEEEGREEKAAEVVSESLESSGEDVVVAITSWGTLPPRFKLILTTAFAFVICNMDKVNMSVAIIPISHTFNWTSTTAGLVQSSFFWGYCISQIPGGWLATTFSGQRVLRGGVLMWSLATAAVPSTASTLPLLLFCRFLVGLGEGVSPAAATDLIASVMPLSERSRAVATVFGGLNVGSVAGLLLAPFIIEHFGWESVFYAFGGLGIAWCFLFESAVGSSMLGNAPLSKSPESSGSGNGSISKRNGNSQQGLQESSNNTPLPSTTSDDKKIPWVAFAKSPAVWAMVYAHFCGNWGHYTLLSWLPTYFSQELHVDLTHAALLSILPPLASVAVTTVAAPLADHYISRGHDVTLIRKVCQSIGFLSPAACMAFAALSSKDNPWVDVAILTSGIGLSSFTFAGLYCTHQDISPKYASVLLGITNTVGAVPGVLGVALVGIILDRTHSWPLALFAPSIFFYLTGTVVWNIFASSKPQKFDS